ncbi:MAG: GIY-YIG nuclease family protein [Candidatus Margulisiibacteriota bacterium]|nr:GIY-YIG nuclease family protein [Candidatus Margulisiibacteriota bacterium]
MVIIICNYGIIGIPTVSRENPVCFISKDFPLIVYMFYLYILKSSKNGKHYIGSTSNPEKRLKKHNAGKIRSTKGLIPLKIVYTECYSTNSDARKRESYIKRQKSRRYIESLFNNS